jgi:hypothetical protein
MRVAPESAIFVFESDGLGDFPNDALDSMRVQASPANDEILARSGIFKTYRSGFF